MSRIIMRRIEGIKNNTNDQDYSAFVRKFNFSANSPDGSSIEVNHELDHDIVNGIKQPLTQLWSGSKVFELGAGDKHDFSVSIDAVYSDTSRQKVRSCLPSQDEMLPLVSAAKIDADLRANSDFRVLNYDIQILVTSLDHFGDPSMDKKNQYYFHFSIET